MISEIHSCYFPFSKKQGHIALHIVQSGCMLFVFITNSIPLTYLPQTWSTPILGTNGTPLTFGLKVKVTGVKCAITVSDQELKNALTYLPQTWSAYPSWVAEEPYRFLIQRSRSPELNVPKLYSKNNK